MIIDAICCNGLLIGLGVSQLLFPHLPIFFSSVSDSSQQCLEQLIGDDDSPIDSKVMPEVDMCCGQSAQDFEPH